MARAATKGGETRRRVVELSASVKRLRPTGTPPVDWSRSSMSTRDFAADSPVPGGCPLLNTAVETGDGSHRRPPRRIRALPQRTEGDAGEMNAASGTVPQLQVRALVPGDDIIGIAHGTRVPAAPNTADVAVVVEDSWLRKGVARRLLAHLARDARERGISRIAATMLADNRPVLGLARAVAPNAAREHGGAEVRMRVALPAARVLVPPLATASEPTVLKEAPAA